MKKGILKTDHILSAIVLILVSGFFYRGIQTIQDQQEFFKSYSS